MNERSVGIGFPIVESGTTRCLRLLLQMNILRSARHAEGVHGGQPPLRAKRQVGTAIDALRGPP